MYLNLCNDEPFTNEMGDQSEIADTVRNVKPCARLKLT